MAAMHKPGERWPDLLEYQGPVANAKRCLKDTVLHSMQVEMQQGLKQPKVRSGQFGGVYKFTDSSQAYALKVFTRAQTERDLRYQVIDTHLEQNPGSPHLLSFNYEREGILCNGRQWPTLVMQWINGLTLDKYLTQALKRDGQVNNGLLCQSWTRLILDLNGRHIAHGDMQQGNILVLADGSLKLVDYDGMFVPAMRGHGLKAPEAGLPAYQHPQRDAAYFDERLDDFSALVVLLTLACLTRDLWTRCNPKDDDKYLIVRKEDLQNPDTSELFNQLLNSPDAPVKKLAIILRRATQGPLDKIPRFPKLVQDITIQEVLTPAWRPTTLQPPAPVTPKAKPKPSAKCANCQANLRPSDKFCRACGTSVAASSGISSGTKQCANCQAGLKANDKFCRRCGTLVSAKTSGGSGSSGPLNLTPRQLEVLEFLVQGLSREQIAQQLSISPTTVSQHITSLKRLSGTYTSDDLVQWGMTQIKVKPPAPVLPVKVKTTNTPPVAPSGWLPNNGGTLSNTNAPPIATSPTVAPTATTATTSSNGQGCVILLIILVVLWAIANWNQERKQQQAQPTPQQSVPAQTLHNEPLQNEQREPPPPAIGPQSRLKMMSVV